ncbi:hypothetical protein ANCDUO_18025, partial [Ancylostoma duodenale]
AIATNKSTKMMRAGNDFSSIARRMLLNRGKTQDVSSNGDSRYRHLAPLQVTPQHVALGSGTVTAEGSPGVLLGEMTLEKFNTPHSIASSDHVRRRRLGRRAETIVQNVRLFFEQVKEFLGDQCRGTIFNKPVQLTARACGVARSTVATAGKRCQSFPRPRKNVQYNRKHLKEATLEKYGNEWGDVVRHLIHSKLKDEAAVTVEELHSDLQERYPDTFPMSYNTLRRFMHGLGFCYRINKGQRYIFENSDVVMKRQVYLSKIEQARTQGHCLVFMDETWVFEAMTTKRGWIDTTAPAKSSKKATIEEYLRSKGVEVSAGSTKADLLEELDAFVSSRGGAAALRRYATEAICRWFREIVREEESARAKIVADQSNNAMSCGEESTSFYSSEDYESGVLSSGRRRNEEREVDACYNQ